MSKLVFLFIAVESVVIFGFQLFGLNILWSVVEDSSGIIGLAVLLGTSFAFRAVSSVFRGFIVDTFRKKMIILVSLAACGVLSVAWLAAERFWIIGILAYIAVIVVQDLYSSSYTALVAEKLSAIDYVKYDSIGIMAGRVVAIVGNLASAVFIILLPAEAVVIVVALVFILGVLVCWHFLPDGDAGITSAATDKIFKPVAAWEFAKENVFGDKKVLVFVSIVFLLNIDYAFIPTMLPLYIISVTELTSPLLFGIIRAGNNVGEFAASGIVLKFSRWVSWLTKIGLAGSALCFVLLPVIYRVPVAVVAFFAVYSFFDTLTQPFYSYFVSSLAADKRGRILGIVDSIILMASPLGILIGGLLSVSGVVAISAGTAIVFLVSFVIVTKSEEYGSVRLEIS